MSLEKTLLACPKCCSTLAPAINTIRTRHGNALYVYAQCANGMIGCGYKGPSFGDSRMAKKNWNARPAATTYWGSRLTVPIIRAKVVNIAAPATNP